MRRLSELARSEPWEKGETAVSRRGRELMAPQVSLPVRMLSGLLAVFLGWGASLGVGEPGNLLFVLGFVALAVVFASIAIFGVRSPVIDPPASRRFLDLADPARALPPSTDPDVPSRGP